MRGVTLDTTLTPELVLEGLRNEIVHRIQGLRKGVGLSITDRAHLTAPKYLEGAMRWYQDYIADEAMLGSITYGDGWHIEAIPQDIGINVNEEVATTDHLS